MLEIRFGSSKDLKYIVLNGILIAFSISMVFPFCILGLVWTRHNWNLIFDPIDLIFTKLFFMIGIVLFPVISFFYCRNHLHKRFCFDDQGFSIFLKQKKISEVSYSDIIYFMVRGNNISFKINRGIIGEIAMGDLSTKDLELTKNFLLNKRVRQV